MQQFKIVRPKEWSNRKFDYQIWVNGSMQGTIANGEEKLLTLHEADAIQMKCKGLGSPTLHLARADNTNTAIQQIKVTANRLLSIWFPLVAVCIISTAALLNQLLPYEGIKSFTTVFLAAIILQSIFVLTFWRNRYLKVEKVD